MSTTLVFRLRRHELLAYSNILSLHQKELTVHRSKTRDKSASPVLLSLNTLIDSMPDEETAWIANEAERRECYKSILASGDHLELIKMIKAIYLHKQELEANKKRLHVSDDRFFKDAEQLLYQNSSKMFMVNLLCDCIAIVSEYSLIGECAIRDK